MASDPEYDAATVSRMWSEAIARVDEARRLQRRGAPTPWAHGGAKWGGRGIVDARGDLVAILQVAPETQAEHAANTTRLVAGAVTVLPGLLALVEFLLQLHQPITDPDGQAICRHCAGHEHLSLYPCVLATLALEAVGVITRKETPS